MYCRAGYIGVPARERTPTRDVCMRASSCTGAPANTHARTHVGMHTYTRARRCACRAILLDIGSGAYVARCIRGPMTRCKVIAPRVSAYRGQREQSFEESEKGRKGKKMKGSRDPYSKNDKTGARGRKSDATRALIITRVYKLWIIKSRGLVIVKMNVERAGVCA